MRTIVLNRGYVALVSNKDYSRAMRFKWFVKEDPRKTPYAHRNVKKPNEKWTRQLLHRFILGVTDPAIKVDHKDRFGLNCQRSNLRKATHGQNRQNSKADKDSASGFKGVYWEKDRNCWTARLRFGRKNLRLGMFTNPKDAAKAYDNAVVIHYKNFATTNASLGLL